MTEVNFNSIHLKKGDLLPPYTGKLRLYNTRFCPFAHRVVLALNAKKIDYEIINIHLIEKPEWLTSKSAFAKVPALEVEEGVSIYESLAIVDYLDDVYQDKPILPTDPVKKAFDKILVEASAPISDVIVRTIKAPNTINEDVVSAYFKALDYIQRQLEQRGSTFLDGEEPGYADYMLWPWFERLPSTNDKRLDMDPLKYKTLIQYLSNMYKDPVVVEYAVPKEIYQEFHAVYSSGKTPNYDLLLK